MAKHTLALLDMFWFVLGPRLATCMRCTAICVTAFDPNTSWIGWCTVYVRGDLEVYELDYAADLTKHI